MSKNYWAFRIAKNHLKYVKDELNEGRLRQGWGWDERQDLRNLTLNEGARRNLSMFNKVKKDDILLIPNYPNGNKVSIVTATEDWNKGYTFDLNRSIGDLGHSFPAKYLNSFSRANEHVSGNIRSTLKNLGRFWDVSSYSIDIEKLINLEESHLEAEQTQEERLCISIENTFAEAFDTTQFEEKLYERVTNQFNAAEWELALITGFKKILPQSYVIEHVGGGKEKLHGADILIRIPGIAPGSKFGIAIQVKDYSGKISEDVITQINKSDHYWIDKEDLTIIDKIVIVTKADGDNNQHIVDNNSGVKFIFQKDLRALLVAMARAHLVSLDQKHLWS